MTLCGPVGNRAMWPRMELIGAQHIAGSRPHMKAFSSLPSRFSPKRASKDKKEYFIENFVEIFAKLVNKSTKMVYFGLLYFTEFTEFFPNFKTQ